tara:strand:- start:340 stop:4203 length:3864 start_codon:yes stop_codon:yes gene_type:complete
VLVTTTTANEPNAQDITVSDEQITVSTTNVLEVGEDAFNYVTPRVKEEFAEDDFGSARSDAKMRELSQNANDRLFQDFITNKDNAGLLMSFLMKFDLQSLRSLKLGVFENSSYKNSLSGAGGKESVLSKAEESLWREHKKSFSDRRETIEESIRAVEKAKDAVTGGAKNPAYREAEQKIKSLRVELDREETQMRASFRLHLKAIEKELGFNWFARYDDDRRQFLNFNRGLLANKDQDVTSASKVEFIDHKKNKSSHTVFKELNNRVDYVRELAMAAGRDKNEANKWAMVYILSWQFTKDNIDLAIKQKMKLIEESEDQSAPGSDVEDTGDDNSDSGDSSVGPVDTSKWNNEQRSRFNAFSTGLMKTTNFSFMGNNQEGKQIIGAYAGVSEAYKQGVPKLQDNLENVFLPKVQEYKNNPKFQADTSSEASAIKKLIKDFEIEMGHVATAKAALRKQGDRLQKYINQYDASVKLNDLADKTKLVNFLRRAVQSGAKITEAENLASRIRNYTQDMLNVIDRSLAAFQTWKEVHKEYKEWEEGNNQDRDRIVEWIKNFDKRRKSIANLHNYGKVAGELVTYVKSKHAERFDSLNIPFSSQITTSCLSLLKGASLEDLKIAKSENPASLDVPVDTLEKQAEQRLFCYANYEWIMKEQASSTEGVKLFDDGRDTPSLAVSMSAIYKFMGTEKDSVKIPEKYDFSIYEGMGSFLKFVDNFRTLFIKYLKSEFKKKGKDIEELSPWTKEDEVTVQRTEHDSVSFRFPAQVLFDTLKATVKPEGHTALKDSLPILLDLLGRDHTSPLISKLVIEGHADSRSAPNYVGESGRTGNDGLSDDRADAVFNYWNQSGASEASAQSFNDFQSQTSIAVERKGYGSSRPVKDDSGAEDMDRSRRVEIKFALNLNAIATIQNDWNKLQQWNEIFNGDLSNGTSQDQNEADSSNDEDSSDSTSESEGSSDADSASEESTGSDDSSETDDDESEGSSSESDADQESQSDQVGYPATHSDSKSQLNDYLFAVEKSGESPKVGTNDLFTVEGEGIMSSFSIDGSYRNVKLNESMIEWLKDNKERVENHDSYFGTSYSEEYNKIYNLYVNKRGEAKLRSIKRDPSWRGPALDKDKLYTLPVTEDMKVLQTVVRKMDDNYSQDVEGLKGQEWQTKIVQELSDISESARLMGYPKNNQSRLYDYGRWQRKISIKPEVALRLSNAIKAASHYDQAHRPMELLAPQLKVIYDQLVNPNGKPKALYHSKPNRPRGGHALRGWKQTWADREIHTPQDIDSKLRKFTELLEGVRF